MTKILQPFINLLPTPIAMYLRWKRIKSDFAKMLEAWNTIGGFQASTELLLNFVNDYSLLIVEYATWTKIELDDIIVKMIRYILMDYRDVLVKMIDCIRNGREMTMPELSAMVENVHAADEYESPMTVLYILSILWQVLQFLKLRDADTVPPLRKRPVINLIRTIFNKR
jgi:hypothetical protein